MALNRRLVPIVFGFDSFGLLLLVEECLGEFVVRTISSILFTISFVIHLLILARILHITSILQAVRGGQSIRPHVGSSTLVRLDIPLLVL